MNLGILMYITIALVFLIAIIKATPPEDYERTQELPFWAHVAVFVLLAMVAFSWPIAGPYYAIRHGK